MKTERSTRRQFLRSLPRHFVERIHSVAKEGILAFAPEGNKMGVSQDLIVRIEVARCHAWTGLLCQQCYLACPKRDEAIEMRDQKPLIIASACDGCAICIDACKTVNDLPAIELMPRMPKLDGGGVRKEESL